MEDKSETIKLKVKDVMNNDEIMESATVTEGLK